jgi:pimeloyl-ACP methyl ester carboxylesterase
VSKRKKMLEIKGNNIFYEIIGNGTPILTIHGFFVDHQLMKGCIEPIVENDNYQRIYFDLPGMGKTRLKEPLYHAEEMYDVIKKVIEKTIGNEHYILMGESYGGYLMRKLIRDEPEKIKGALFICPVILPLNNRNNLPERTILYNEIEDEKIKESSLYHDFMNMAVLSNTALLRDYEHDVYSGIQNADVTFLKTYQQSGYAYLEDVDDTHAPFMKPTLFIMGKQDHIVGFSDAYTLLSRYPRASFCILDEAGHNLPLEKGAVFKALIKDWLERIKRNEKSAQ